MIAFGTHSVSAAPGIAPAALVADNACSASRPSPAEQTRTPDTATLHDELAHHWQPVGPIEAELVRQLAQMMADVQTYEIARDTAIASAYSTFSDLFESMNGMTGEKRRVSGVSGEAGCPRDVPSPAGSAEPPDMALVSAIKSDPVRYCEHMLATKQQRFLMLIKDLERQRELRQIRSLPRLAQQARITVDCVPDDRISDDRVSVDGATVACVAAVPAETQAAGYWLPATTEADCEALFRAWRRTARLPCPHCGSRELPLELTGRRVLQCRACEAQYGLRHGTIIARTKITFRAFIHVVRLLAHEPMTPWETLRQATGLCRRTLTKLAAVIHEALPDPVRRDELLTACGWRHEQE